MKPLSEILDELVENGGKYEPCMSLHVNQDGQSVEFLAATNLDTYAEWIPGEGADICLIREFETNRVVGIRLPLLNQNLAVFHDGPLKINEGFLKPEG